MGSCLIFFLLTFLMAMFADFVIFNSFIKMKGIKSQTHAFLRQKIRWKNKHKKFFGPFNVDLMRIFALEIRVTQDSCNPLKCVWALTKEVKQMRWILSLLYCLYLEVALKMKKSACVNANFDNAACWGMKSQFCSDLSRQFFGWKLSLSECQMDALTFSESFQESFSCEWETARMCLLTIERETSDLCLCTEKIHFRPKYRSYLFDKTLSNAKR